MTTTDAELAPNERACVLQAADVRQMRDITVPHGVPAHEARRGPWDGTRGAVALDGQGDLPAHITLAGGDIVYELDGFAPDRVAVYRYAPAKSPMHGRIMAGVQQAYFEAAAKKAAGGGR
ncbi:hypothetical protein [Saccharothrix sp. ST-888]|uniref:hypothetical protein n=1 Tax=Saccharothrix sp. ST-888 TaxID=1427391 RepID=UPI0005ECA056|nr:hypothetical protein [Saccharothrix sp. ST-888]KJK55637.1 hypothetical protein UK12_27335 [Saccharothrix sp. ST-888]